jgi:carboxymethylenebutenolidase
MTVPGGVLDTSHLVTEDVSIDVDGANVDAYLARAPGESARPGVIVIHEAFGPVEHIRDVARRFANVGFDALAPNMYAREGAPPAGDVPACMATMFAVPDQRAVADLEAAAKYLRALPNANGKVGCVGFCSGGRQALLFASSSDHVDAAIDCWGGYTFRADPEHATTASRPVPVSALVANIVCPVLLVGGAEDQNPSSDDLRALAAVDETAGMRMTVRVFGDAGHAFFADYRPNYREAAAFALWPVMVEFLQSHMTTEQID